MPQRLDRLAVPAVLEPELAERLDGSPLLHALVAELATLLGSEHVHDHDHGPDGHDHGAEEQLLVRYEVLLDAGDGPTRRAATRSLRQLAAVVGWAIDDLAGPALAGVGLVPPPADATPDALAAAVEGAERALAHGVDASGPAPGPAYDGTCLGAVVDAPVAGASWPAVVAALAADDAALAAMAECGADAAITAADALADELAEGADDDDPLVAWVDEQAGRVAAAAHLAEVAYRLAAYEAARGQADDGGRPADAAVQARVAGATVLIGPSDAARAALVRVAREIVDDVLVAEQRERGGDRRRVRGPKRRGPERRA